MYKEQGSVLTFMLTGLDMDCFCLFAVYVRREAKIPPMPMSSSLSFYSVFPRNSLSGSMPSGSFSLTPRC